MAVLGPLRYGAIVWAGADGVWLAQRPSVTSLLQLPHVIVDLSVYPLPPLGCLDHQRSVDLAWGGIILLSAYNTWCWNPEGIAFFQSSETRSKASACPALAGTHPKRQSVWCHMKQREVCLSSVSLESLPLCFSSWGLGTLLASRGHLKMNKESVGTTASRILSCIDSFARGDFFLRMVLQQLECNAESCYLNVV